MEGVAGDALLIQTHNRDRGRLRGLGCKIKFDVRLEDVLSKLTTESISRDPTQEMRIAPKLAQGDR
jgi:hypothetical protein